MFFTVISVIITILLSLFLLLSSLMSKSQSQSQSQSPTTSGFFPFYKSRSQPSSQDITAVYSATINDRTPENVALFHETDIDVTRPFRRVIPEANPLFLYPYTYVVANNPLLHLTAVILKLYYNRKRPYQYLISTLNATQPIIIPLSYKTSRTPSYPSSHAVQSFALAKHLSRVYPHKAKEISLTAERVANARIIGGVHFPSDKEFARRIVDSLPWI